MVELRCDLDLLMEALRTQRGCQFSAEDFDGYLALVLQIFGKVDGCHPAAPNLPFDCVSIGEGSFQAVKDIGHVGLLRRSECSPYVTTQ